MQIDWTKPLEAYHTDGRVVPVELNSGMENNPDDQGDYYIEPLPDVPNIWSPNGIAWLTSDSPWRIRNRHTVSYEDLIRRAAAGENIQAEAKALLPVDPKLKRAREIAAEVYRDAGFDDYADNILTGTTDVSVGVKAALKALNDEQI